MKAVIQRVDRACVRVDGETVGECGRGFLILLGVAEGDTEAEADLLCRKTVGLRVFPDEAGKARGGKAALRIFYRAGEENGFPRRQRRVRRAHGSVASEQRTGYHPARHRRTEKEVRRGRHETDIGRTR